MSQHPPLWRVVPAPMGGTADVGKVLLGTDGPAIKPQSKTLVPAVSLTSEGNPGKLLIKHTIVTAEQRGVSSPTRMSASVGLPLGAANN